MQKIYFMRLASIVVVFEWFELGSVDFARSILMFDGIGGCGIGGVPEVALEVFLIG